MLEVVHVTKRYRKVLANDDINLTIEDGRIGHGRGGGRNGFAQGSVETERSAIESFFKENGYGICD